MEITSVSCFPVILICCERELCRGPLALCFEERVRLEEVWLGAEVLERVAKRQQPLFASVPCRLIYLKFAGKPQYLNGPPGGGTTPSFRAFEAEDKIHNVSTQQLDGKVSLGK